MQIGSAAVQSSSTQASLPAQWRTPKVSAADTSSSSLTASPDSTVTLSAAGTRLAAADKDAAGQNAEPSKDTSNAEQANPQQQQMDRQAIAELSSRDADVRSHEQAHASVGGAYAGSPSFTMQRGPDGKSYAVGGEVGIDVSAVANDPAATISKMEVVMRAALAPADPSAQDLRVAAQAQGLAAAARAELAQQRRADAMEQAEKKQQEKTEPDSAASDSPSTDNAQNPSAAASLQVYQSVAAPLDTTPQLVAIA
ncbi:MAG: putative metalloprotease CJM1_0395 family protein [Pseudomonas sp.]|uniref:putative metalloprotease CJM1_0395 family protein n=1 Tax=Pseudomonas sp. TaxID=306 RepID=UPI0030F03176